MNSATEVYEKLRTDTAALERITDAPDLDAIKSGVIDYAKGLGHRLSTEEVDAALADLPALIQATAGDALTDAELELVAAGSVVSSDNDMGK